MPTYLQSLRTGKINTITSTYSSALKGFFKTNSTWGSDGYVHMKTNISTEGAAGGLYTIEAVGYNYGLAQDIFCLWSFDNVVKTKGSTTLGEGLIPSTTPLSGIYTSGDGYVVIYAYSNSFYYAGFALNSYSADVDVNDIQITAISYNTNAWNYY